MKAKLRTRTSALLSCGAISVLFAPSIYCQTLINLGSQGRNADFTNFPYTRPIKTGTVLPTSCSVGDVFFNINATAGQNLFACTAANLWSQQAGLTDPGSNGLLKRTGTNTTTVVAAPTGSIVGTTDTQVLTNKSIDASEITSGVLSSARIPALTGDVTTASNSTLSTLATVNNTPGTYGDASHALQLTVDAKGRVTGINQLTITGISGPSYYQQLTKNGTSVTQRPTLNLSSAFSVTDNSSNTRTDVDLVQVNSNPGTFGGASAIPVITVNAYGQITSVSTVAAQSSSSSSVTANSGTFSTIPSSCAAGSLYLATDQPVGQQLYTCSSSNNWTQLLSVGGSGALAVTNGSLDIVPSVVPRLNAANTFTGLNSFSSGIRLTSSGTQQTCDASSRGVIWFQNNGSSKDGLQVCVYTGSAYSWVSLY